MHIFNIRLLFNLRPFTTITQTCSFKSYFTFYPSQLESEPLEFYSYGHQCKHSLQDLYLKRTRAVDNDMAFRQRKRIAYHEYFYRTYYFGRNELQLSTAVLLLILFGTRAQSRQSRQTVIPSTIDQHRCIAIVSNNLYITYLIQFLC